MVIVSHLDVLVLPNSELCMKICVLSSCRMQKVLTHTDHICTVKNGAQHITKASIITNISQLGEEHCILFSFHSYLSSID